ncbi:hypothetical protein BFF78_22015 [Streptomyces fodineus]|uniref:Uncharacterized protein n=1 Tax=Streptomyces fodineus TaxID=1904616 RepID=A0A1D7YNT3_9ACTN|nr:hypothetical protein BFF78_22015 [Streptomyces fodineus]
MLLLALWVPAAHVQAHTAPAPGASAEAFEHDAPDTPDAPGVPDTLVRPSARTVHRADAPERPAPLPDPAPAAPAARPCSAPPRAPYPPSLPRTVVLRC